MQMEIFKDPIRFCHFEEETKKILKLSSELKEGRLKILRCLFVDENPCDFLAYPLPSFNYKSYFSDSVFLAM